MRTPGLASPQELCDTPAEQRAFEESWRSARLVDLAEVVERRLAIRDADWTSLFRYVTEHWEVLAVLLEAPEKVREVFGEVRPILDIIIDPEEGWEQLFVVIPTQEPAGRALDRLSKLDATWFAEAARRARFSISVTIEHHV